MLAKRIIPCLDVKDGRTVKGINFGNLTDAGDIVELAKSYCTQGADELVFLDISATDMRRKTMGEWVSAVAGNINIPFTVGGGITSERDVEELLKKGADKISVNSAAVADPELINRLAYSFGRQCVVTAVDAKKHGTKWYIHVRGGKDKTDKELLEWCLETESRGAGEILLTSIDEDGTRKGFACDMLQEVSQLISIPLIASGGAGCAEHFYEVFSRGKVDAALAAGIFHYGELTVNDVKNYLANKGVEVRL